MRALILGVLLIAHAPVHAALVDNGSYTTDTASGLDWLDLELTAGWSLTDSLSENPGWRLPTNDEVQALFDVLFDGYYDNHSNNSSYERFGAYADQREDVARYLELFGVGMSSVAQEIMSGYYYDENGDARIMGVTATIENGYTTRDIVESRIDGMNYVALPCCAELGLHGDSHGWYLVQTTVVPIPAAVWLFGSGLGMLGWFRRRQTA